MDKEPKHIVVIGASAGGLNSVIELSAQLKNEMDIAVLIVLHLSHISLADILIIRIQANTVFTCKVAEHNELIKSRHIYMAATNQHLLVKEGRIVLGDGPQENRWRPSIDVLFRSAAAGYDGRTIGIILSGLLQDGTSGMQAIQRCGGTTIVQNPAEAEYPDMPRSVLEHVKVDYCTSLAEMGAILLEKSKNGVEKKTAIPADVLKEAEITERMATNLEAMHEVGESSLYSCPDCGGGLWQVRSGNFLRYRCHTGHVYTQDEFMIRQSEALENTLWVALRMLEERKNLLDRMAKEERSKGWIRNADNKVQRSAELLVHIERLKEILFQTKNSEQNKTEYTMTK